MKFNGIQNANSVGWLEEDKGVRTMKQKADARSDIEGRMRKNLNKKGESTHIQSQLFYSNWNNPAKSPQPPEKTPNRLN